MGALDDALAFVFRHCGKHRREAAPHRGFEVDIVAVEHLHGRPGVDYRLDDLQAVPHRARGAIPFGDNENVAFVDVLKRGGQFGASDHAVAGRGIGIDHLTTSTFQRVDLTGEVLVLRADAGVADEAFFGFTCETHL